MNEFLKRQIKWLTVIMSLSILTVLSSAGRIYCQDDYSVHGFIDEDGDGFNDLLPDSDGDGVPDMLDPDSHPNPADSGYMHRYMHENQEQHQMMWENMNGDMMGGPMEHGEPGMYGPGDSTMHGGHEGGGDGHHHGGGMNDPGGGMGGGSDPGGGGMGGGMGHDSTGMGGGPESIGNRMTDPANKPPELEIRNNQHLEKNGQPMDDPGGKLNDPPRSGGPGKN